MKKFLIIICVFFPVISFSGCIVDSEENYQDMLDNFPNRLKYIRFKDGREVGEDLYVNKGTPQYDKLVKWVSSNQTGWNRDYNTYAPSHLFDSENVNINVLDGIVVVNLKTKDTSWIQISKKYENGKGPLLKP